MFFRPLVAIRRNHKPRICCRVSAYKAFFKAFLYSKAKHLLLKDSLVDKIRPAGAGRTAFHSERREVRSGKGMPVHHARPSGDPLKRGRHPTAERSPAPANETGAKGDRRPTCDSAWDSRKPFHA